MSGQTHVVAFMRSPPTPTPLSLRVNVNVQWPLLSTSAFIPAFKRLIQGNTVSTAIITILIF